MIAVVITDFNGWEQTRTCLARLAAALPAGVTPLVVDHGTTGETADGLRASFPEAIHLRASSELWWTGATNAGIREALRRGASAVMLLNNDCYVAPDTLRRTLAHAALAGPRAIVAPLQRNASDGALRRNLVRSCYLLGFPTVPLPWPRGAKAGEARLMPTRLIIGGRGVLIPRAVLDEVGLFDEQNFPHYAADHDFYHRCARAGIRLYLALDAFVDIDDARTSRATDSARLSFREMTSTLRDPRSHRNVKTLTALFRRHYPVPGLHPVGVALNVARYVARYMVSRLLARRGS